MKIVQAQETESDWFTHLSDENLVHATVDDSWVLRTS
jgi:hypothetical protein